MRKKPPAAIKKLDPSKTVASTEKKVYTLPTKATVPSIDLRDYSMLLMGEKKIGKTTLASMFPDTFFMLTEPGGKGLKLFARNVVNWKDANGYLRLLEEDDDVETPRFKYVVIDTADILAKKCQTYVCARMGIEHPSDEEWGKGWSAVRDEFTEYMTRILSLNKGIIFTSHTTEREVKSRDGSKHDRIVSTMPKFAAETIEGLVDMWFYFTYDGEDRVLMIRGDEQVAAGHRLQKNFRTPDGLELREIAMGTSAEIGYQNLLDAFANEYAPSKKVASEEPPPIKKKMVIKKRVG